MLGRIRLECPAGVRSDEDGATSASIKTSRPLGMDDPFHMPDCVSVCVDGALGT